MIVKGRYQKKFVTYNKNQAIISYAREYAILFHEKQESRRQADTDAPAGL